ncbi:hypothetical protein CHLRE_02g114575v5 [Chlamydomonas reinhardtii]|uniref:Cas12f1-like TNB domain-containing protein n=1 Tax=Chlamydomonas reinhardtii TaxID=3055 RepID=A0A2K3E376_CHLRE|nr:uncharacterized protein CHLRE_02g114575v5 [Chlamydomonas reinhardtii]PNW87239.1 hypothetical protein CHLRE_02g114575v5 [Chlamydomonas reinhardtii]
MGARTPCCNILLSAPPSTKAAAWAGAAGRGPNRALLRLLVDKYAHLVVYVDEYYTSQVCAKCGRRLLGNGQRCLEVVIPFGGSRARDVQVCQHCGTVWGRDANSATNMRHALMEMLLGKPRPAALRPAGGGGGAGPGGGGGGGGGAGPGDGGGGGGGTAPTGGNSSGHGVGPGGGGGTGGPGPSGSGGAHVRSRGGRQGHVEEDSAVPPSKRRRRAG